MTARFGLAFLMGLMLAMSYLVRALAALVGVGGAPFELGLTLLAMYFLHRAVASWAKL